jgi:hypothetical protein
MIVYLEFPPNRLTAIKNAYMGQHIRSTDNPNEDEQLQDNPPVDATGTRMIIGSSRMTSVHSGNLQIGNAPWLIIHDTWPADWQYPEINS